MKTDPKMRVLQHVRHDEETHEEVRALEIHEVSAQAWQDIFWRVDMEAKHDIMLRGTTNICGTRDIRWTCVNYRLTK